jgi:hypothetical protein
MLEGATMRGMGTGTVRWAHISKAMLTLALVCGLGCQTWEGGMTLPSPHYLKDSPDYIPRKSAFDLPNELRQMQQNAVPGAVATPVP